MLLLLLLLLTLTPPPPPPSPKRLRMINYTCARMASINFLSCIHINSFTYFIQFQRKNKRIFMRNFFFPFHVNYVQICHYFFPFTRVQVLQRTERLNKLLTNRILMFYIEEKNLIGNNKTKINKKY